MRPLNVVLAVAVTLVLPTAAEAAPPPNDARSAPQADATRWTSQWWVERIHV